MNQKRRNNIALAWICFAGSILLLVANLTGIFEMRAAIPIAMLLLIFGILLAAAAKKDAVE